MNKEIRTISFSHIHQLTPILRNMNDSLLLTDETDVVSEMPDKTFRYPFRLDGIVLMMLDNSTAKVRINFNDYVVDDGTMLLCMPGDILQFVDATITNARPKAMLISMSMLEEMRIDLNSLRTVLPFHKINPLIRLRESEKEELSEIYAIIRKEINRNNIFHREIICNMATVYIYKIASLIAGHAGQTTLTPRMKYKREQMILCEFIRLVSEHHCRERHLDFYADKLFVSPKYLSAVIRRGSERTAKEWIADYVVLEIKYLLQYTNMSIQEISNALNFPNQSFLGKFFKKHTGMSPYMYKTALLST